MVSFSRQPETSSSNVALATPTVSLSYNSEKEERKMK
jgi:hypothetical protein